MQLQKKQENKERFKPVIYKKLTLKGEMTVLYWHGEKDLQMREFIIFLPEYYFPVGTTIDDVEILFIGQPQGSRRYSRSNVKSQKKYFVLFAEIPYVISAEQIDGERESSGVKFTSEIMPTFDELNRIIYPKKFNS